MKTKAEKPPNFIPMQKSKMETKAFSHKKHKHENKLKQSLGAVEQNKASGGTKSSKAAKMKKHMISLKRFEKREQLKAATGKDGTPAENSTCLLLRHLPQSINYNTLKSIVPDAVHVEIYKKGAKRHAFAQFDSHTACKKTMEGLCGFKLDDHEILVKYVSRRPKTQENTLPPPPSPDTCITLSNLPFSITKAELEEEFPTAAEVILNVNKNGRFRGSCLLRFESSDDCKVVWDACCGRKIGGRPVQCRAGICFQAPFAQPSRQLWGIKVCNLPVEVTNSQLASLFPQQTLAKAHCELDSVGLSKTGIVQFSSVDAQKNALQMLNENEFFGVRLRCRPWVPRKSRSKPLSLVGNQDTVERPPSSKKTEQKKTAVASEEQAESLETSFHSKMVSPQSGKKTKRQRNSLEAETAEISALSDLGTPFKKHKQQKRDSF